ncbi:MAG: hypothetical protein WC340_06150, partial [Kiritimatiellia bacterium]
IGVGVGVGIGIGIDFMRFSIPIPIPTPTPSYRHETVTKWPSYRQGECASVEVAPFYCGSNVGPISNRTVRLETGPTGGWLRYRPTMAATILVDDLRMIPIVHQHHRTSSSAAA